MTTTVNTRTNAITLSEKAKNKWSARIEKRANKFVAKTLKNIAKAAKTGSTVVCSPKIKKHTPIKTVTSKLEARGFMVKEGSEYLVIKWSDRA